MTNTLNRFRNLCRQIDEFVLSDVKTGMKLGEDLKTLAVYTLEIETAPVQIARMKTQLDAFYAKPPCDAETAKLKRRMRDNWECALRTDQEIARLERQLSYTRTMKKLRKAAEFQSEIAALTSSNLERRATHLELWAAYYPTVLAEQYKREAGKIRHTLQIERAERAHQGQLDKLDAMMALAEKVVIELDKRAKARAKMTPLAALARDVMQTQAANDIETETPPQAAEPETVADTDAAHEVADATAEEPKIDPDLLAFMMIEGLDPENPDHVALAAAMADPCDLEAARDLMANVA
ncbi:MAG: hypothetical protein QY323_04595 [Patescibacteria group bacterium]|nr:MAG: hypothetical protein QY323_04595 [Patescibacteria group bacterium]